MKIITSGSKYIDIDAYASIIAYRELLKLKGIEAKAVSTAKTNESITESLLNLNIKLDKYIENEEDEFIVIDVSNKDFFDEIVKENKIIEIIDHHVGFEEYWKNKLGEKSNIEFIGAVATIIFELYEKEKLISNMSKDVAKLLMCAILDNTLNFKAKVTKERDIQAYNKLKIIAGIDNNFAEKYFIECEKIITKDLKNAVKNDTKVEKISNILPLVFGQLLVWDKENVLKNKQEIVQTLENIDKEWMMNLICLKDGKSYIIANDSAVKNGLEKLLNGKFENDIMELNDVWLRKEIIKKARKLDR